MSGNSGSHTVKIVTAGGTDVAGASVSVATYGKPTDAKVGIIGHRHLRSGRRASFAVWLLSFWSVCGNLPRQTQKPAIIFIFEFYAILAFEAPFPSRHSRMKSAAKLRREGELCHQFADDRGRGLEFAAMGDALAGVKGHGFDVAGHVPDRQA
jgi:hypothetical protein